jgi:protease I
MATILMPLPDRDFDPTETGVPWRALSAHGHRFVFATPDGKAATADPRMVTGEGLGLLAPLLKADANGHDAYVAMAESTEFRTPISFADLGTAAWDALILPGGHAKGMRVYLEAAAVQATIAAFFAAGKPVGAICHGVLAAARSRDAAGRSVLHGRKTTALTRMMELTAWTLTVAYLGDYYRTYPVTVEDEVKAALAKPEDFQTGPLAVKRDAPDRLGVGFTVRDGLYLSARWPGDAHRFAADFATLLEH